MINELRTGPTTSSDGSILTARSDKQGAGVVTDAHLRMHEANYRGTLFQFGISSTALVAANAVATGVTATAQPIIGVWNPATSGVNLVIMKAIVSTTVVANTAVAPGGFVWLSNINQASVTTGSVPFNCKTLAQTGSNAKAFACSTALTGLSGSLSTMRACGLSSINAAGPATAIHQPCPSIEELVDGSLIVPPGGVLAIMNQVSTTTISVNSGIVWEEVAI